MQTLGYLRLSLGSQVPALASGDDPPMPLFIEQGLERLVARCVKSLAEIVVT
jgi:hypothetical protein